MDVIQYLLGEITKREAEISESLMSNGIASMEQYHHFMGQVSALGYMAQTLRETRQIMENAHND